MKRGEIRALTGLRGIAAVYVALYHIHWASLAETGHTWLRHGYLSVDVFFVLSGFVMSLTYAGMFAGPLRPSNYAEFMVRRIARIWPPYILVIIFLQLCFVLRVLQNPPASVPEFLANATFTQLWFGVREIDEPSWSVSAEFGVYLLFPVIVLLLRTRRAQSLLLAGVIGLLICGLPALGRAMGHEHDGNGPLDLIGGSTLLPMLRCLLEFTLGVLTYRIASSGEDRFYRHPAFLLALCALIAALLCVPDTDVLIVLLIPPLLLALATDSVAAQALFGNRVVHALGLWSYALYLIHFHSNKIHTVLLHGLGRFGAAAIVLSWIGQYAILLAAAALLYRLVERPGQRFIRGLGQRIRDRRARLFAAPLLQAKGGDSGS